MRPVSDKFKVTQKYGNKSSLYKKSGGMHKGIDYGCPEGTPVYAAVGGKVIHSGKHVVGQGWGNAFGIHIVIDQDKFADGSGGKWGGYMHLSKVVAKKGSVVKKGDVIGYSGQTGHCTGPHLHYEVQMNAHWNKLGSIDPKKWIEA